MTRSMTHKANKLMGMMWLMGFCLLGASSASAYQIKKTKSGQPIRWFKQEISYKINRELTRDVPNDSPKDAIQRSFQSWSEAAQGKLQFRFAGYTSTRTAGFNREDLNANENVFFWVERGWPHDPQAMAITIATYNQQTGEILDADVMFNGEHYRWAVIEKDRKALALSAGAADRRPVIDIENTATHEIGHFLGLSHSNHPESTMFASESPYETKKRSLHQDDIDGFMKLYGGLFESKEELTLQQKNLNTQGLGCSSLNRQDAGLNGLALFGLLCFFGLAWKRNRAARAAQHAQSVGFQNRLANAPNKHWQAGLFGLFFLSVAVYHAPAHATSSKWLSLQDLSQQATLIVSGKVIAQKAAWEGRLIYTTSTIQLEKCWKGNCKQQMILVRQLGGKVGKYGMIVEGIRHLQLHSKVLLFLSALPSKTHKLHRVVGLSQGAFTFIKKGKATYLQSDRSGLILYRFSRTNPHQIQKIHGTKLTINATLMLKQLATLLKKRP